MQWSIILLVAGIENGKQEKCASNVQIVTFLVAVFHVIVLGGSFVFFLNFQKEVATLSQLEISHLLSGKVFIN